MKAHYREFVIRDWQPDDRTFVSELISSVLTEYCLGCEPM
jgi:putative acetyltransferase